MVIILGIDPALHHTGWGVVRKQGSELHYLASGCIRTMVKQDGLAQALGYLHKEVAELCQMYKPNYGAIEETYVNNNARTSLVLGQARGAILVALAQANLVVQYFAAATIKKVVAGHGRADKQQIQHMVKLLLPNAKPTSVDAADALAIAICAAINAPRFNSK